MPSHIDYLRSIRDARAAIVDAQRSVYNRTVMLRAKDAATDEDVDRAYVVLALAQIDLAAAEIELLKQGG